MPRYNPTERIAVAAVEMAFVREVGWIFREQPGPDVGMDAMVEEVAGGDPMGRFIMVQVKGGESHVHDGKHGYTFYLSLVHYEYYMRVSLPVILAIHLPVESRVVWAPINRKTAKRAQLNWKLNISKDRVLNASAKRELTQILNGFTDDEDFALLDETKVRTYEELVEDLALLPDCIPPILSIAEAYTAFSASMQGLNRLLDGYVERSLPSSSPQVRGVLKRANTSFVKLAQSQQRDLDHFVEDFGISVSAVHSLVLDPLVKALFSSSLVALRIGCLGIVQAIDATDPRLHDLLQTINKLSKYHSLTSGRKKATEVTEALIREFGEARALEVIAAIDRG